MRYIIFVVYYSGFCALLGRHKSELITARGLAPERLRDWNAVMKNLRGGKVHFIGARFALFALVHKEFEDEFEAAGICEKLLHFWATNEMRLSPYHLKIVREIAKTTPIRI